MPEETPPNGTRITLAILNTNVVHLTQQIEALRADVCAKLNDHEARLRAVERWDQTSQEKWVRHEDDHKSLNAKNWAADVIGSVAAAIAGIVAGRA